MKPQEKLGNRPVPFHNGSSHGFSLFIGFFPDNTIRANKYVGSCEDPLISFLGLYQKKKERKKVSWIPTI